MVQQELDGAGIHIPALLRHPLGQITDVFALAFLQLRRRRQLNQFLVAALNGAIPLVQMHNVAVGIGQNLHLDVTGLDDAFLEKHLGTTKRFGGLGDYPLVVLPKLLFVVAAADTPAAPAGGGLQHHRVADIGGLGHGILNISKVAFRPWSHRHARGNGGLARLSLVTHG